MKDKEFLCSCHEFQLSEPKENGLITVVASIVGEWKHPIRDFNISKEDLTFICNDFQKKKKELLFDYDHRSLGVFGCESKAAGWGKEMRVTSEGLEIDVEFTPVGLEMVKNKEYRYLSPVYQFSSQRKDRKVYLHSVALTNVPFLKELPAITNSEQNKGEQVMLEELLKLLQCSEETVTQKVQELMTQSKDLATKNSELLTQNQEVTVKNSELVQRVKDNELKLAEFEVDLAIANNSIRADQKQFALSLRTKDPELFNQFVKSNTVQAPQGNLNVPNNQQNNQTSVKLSDLLSDLKKMEEYKAQFPVEFAALYDEFIENGGK